MQDQQNNPNATPDSLARVQAALSQRKRAAVPFVLAEAHARLFDRLSYIKTEVRSLAVVGAGYGESHAALRLRYPQAALIDCALSGKLLAASTPTASSLERLAMGLKRLTGKPGNPPSQPHICAPDALPLAADSVDLVWANLAGLAWGTPDSLLAEWQRVLKPGGFVMFSALGPDTARQAVQALARAGTLADCSRLIDMHDWGDALLHAGLSDPVMDMETLTLEYSSGEPLLAELAQLLPTRPLQAGLKNNARAYRAELHNTRSLTLELVFGHAFKVARVPNPLSLTSTTSTTLDSLKASLPSHKLGKP